MKPAFLPLKKEYYLQFKTGVKTHEYRLHRRQFNEKNFFTGREVTLSNGYGNSDRAKGVISSFCVVDLHELHDDKQKTLIALYGNDAKVIPIAVIGIKLNA